jgi:hypothetical protein
MGVRGRVGDLSLSHRSRTHTHTHTLSLTHTPPAATLPTTGSPTIRLIPPPPHTHTHTCRHHHRFTNDPARDPELSGTTVDRADPTQAEDLTTRIYGYAVFLSGYPFGFERLPGIAKHAFGYPDPESWIDTPKKHSAVQLEYIFFLAGYILLLVAGLLHPITVGAPLWYYWVLPHILGAGHLRYYQTAEHRACQMGEFTDTNAWGARCSVFFDRILQLIVLLGSHACRV